MGLVLPEYHAPDFAALGLEGAPEARLAPAERDGVVPAGYHATSIFPEYFHIGGTWRLAEESEEQTYFDLCYYFRRYERIS